MIKGREVFESIKKACINTNNKNFPKEFSKKKNNITLDKKINKFEFELDDTYNCDYYSDNSDSDINSYDEYDKDEQFFNLLLLYYEKYNIENIIDIKIEKIIKYKNSFSNPLRLYDAEENKIINNTKDKSYVTISHRWNDNDKNIESLDKYEKLKKIKNIYKKNKKLRYFWIDTICIDQNNIREKEKEISNMKYYYKNSLMTIILNEVNIKDEKIRKVLNLLLIILPENDINDNLILFLLSMLLDEIEVNDDWHKRCWTLQESILNRNILFYINSLDNFLLLKTIPLPSDTSFNSNIKINNNRLYKIWLEIKNSKNIYNIGEVIQLTKNRESILLQDKIYSILGLIDDRISNNIKINYDLEIENIYINLFKESAKIGDYTWLNIAIGFIDCSIYVLYEKIIINNNKIFLKSYIINDNVKNLIKVEKLNYPNNKTRMKEFFEKLTTISNIKLNNKISYLFDKFFSSNLKEEEIEIEKDMSILYNYLLKLGYNDLINFIIMDECIGITNVYNINDKIIMLNNYSILPNNWWYGIIIDNNNTIGYCIININKKYFEKKDVEININLNNYLKYMNLSNNNK